jgi:hypothetical protein
MERSIIILKNMKMQLKHIVLLISGLTMLAACVKTIEDTSPIDDDMTTKARIQIFNATVGTGARNLITVDANRINAPGFTYGSVFPALPSTSFAVPAGLRAFNIIDTLATTTMPPLTFAENFSAGNFYTIFLYDTLNAIKQKTVLTNIVVPDDTTARVRFANFIYSSNAVPNVDVFSFRRNANVWTNIPVKEVTEFIPYQSGVVDTFYVRETGTMTQLAKAAVGSFTAKRSYTAIFRGSYRVAASRTISTFINY